MNRQMNILIAYDGSECADAALDDLRRAGLPGDAEATVLTVAEVWLPTAAPSAADDSVAAVQEADAPVALHNALVRRSRAFADAKQLAERAGERVQHIFPGWRVRAEAGAGSPAWEVIMRVDEMKFDLVVVGSHGRTALGRAMMGSVSQKVLAETRCSVRIARGRSRIEPSSARLVVGVDGSNHSNRAVDEVARRKWSTGSEARLVTAYQPFYMYGILPEGQDAQDESAQAVSAQRYALGELTRAGLQVSSAIVEGDPKRALVREAEEFDADCIFIGAQGHGFVERVLLGSVSYAVAARAGCSVEVVR